MASSVRVNVQEERWSSTGIKTAYAFQLPSYRPSSGDISINFPLPSLGWTFAMSLTPKHKPIRRLGEERLYDWRPATFSFQQHDSVHRWQNTSICAKLSFDEECTDNNLGAMNVVLAHNPTSQVPLADSPILSSSRPNKVWLTVTISDCPLPNGLFDARSGFANEAEVQAQLVKQNVLSQSLTTGKFIDVKFMAPSTRPHSGKGGTSLPTYASLSILAEHVNVSSCQSRCISTRETTDGLEAMLAESWKNALASLSDVSGQRFEELSTPEGYEYDELDSDFEDEEEASCPPCDRDVPSPEGQLSESGTERSSSSLSSFEPLEGASHQGSTVNQLEELIKGPTEPEELPFNELRTIQVGFAAHRTWHAFLWYCYTDNLKFGTLRSQAEPGTRHLCVPLIEGEPPTCSPKSMYRLADLLGDQDLKAKALAAIKERMTEANVLDETFSVFTSRYPDVRRVQLGVLGQHRRSPMVKKAFLRAMEKYNSMSHAEPVLSAFYDNLMA